MFREYHSKDEFIDELRKAWNKRVKSIRTCGIIVGIIMMVLGVMACIWPVQTALVVEVVASIVILILGIFEIYAYFSIPAMMRTGAGLVSGILNIIVAIMLLTSPEQDMLVSFSFLLAADLMLLGIEEISASGKLAFLGIGGLGMSVADGWLKIIASLVLILMPIASTAAASIVIGVYLIAGGLSLLIQSIRAGELKAG